MKLYQTHKFPNTYSSHIYIDLHILPLTEAHPQDLSDETNL